MKFSFATAFLTLTAASAVAFAAPAQDDSTKTGYFLCASFTSHRPAYKMFSETAFSGLLILNGRKFDGRVDGRPVIGELTHQLPFIIVNPADYRLHELSELNGPFKGRIDRGDVFIKYIKSDATITGKANAGHLIIDFEGETKNFDG